MKMEKKKWSKIAKEGKEKRTEFQFRRGQELHAIHGAKWQKISSCDINAVLHNLVQYI